ncbi:MAG: NAD(P)H-dependent oxidoreductase [Minisyncoccia bacterium]
MRIFLLLGHPDSSPEPLSRHVADAYERAAKQAGHEVRRMNISDMAFDPVLHHGYRERMNLEPDLLKVQENITWCEHFVLAYPNWWGGMPALLKGMWDRMFLPRFAFSMHKNRLGWDRLLKGRTARVFIMCGNPPILDYIAFGNFAASIGWSILRFAGFKTRITSFGPSENPSESRHARFIRKVECFAQKGK